ncbi:putative sodium/metabolite cotransporter BASS1, chloroplastic [Gracilariopsis chorda]|uniref:Putative sodium/metabolite cotransporter BASS1, chloroplastic n=1 Tax=Gracilariopsis chorda TaxID=448386 RepID=A0A2V3IR50_9FLOR|nr:putative sodium/metabolite cotransporter BASS1, chloroplastic [Gracilariopsis chorda]|eukprot:PXF44573.1 putative sodium/metabolite cotransporter BASS1, chloroplastic [Gracilariopsis chorda]
MLGMGLTIDPDSFSAVLKVPHHILLGACAQYTLMPLLACAVSYLLRLPPALAAGVILVGVCPGGAASNVICLLARANVAFSVVLTLTSTILSVVLIPSLMQVLAGTLVPVAPLALLKSTAQVVLLPLLLGCVLQRLFPRLVAATSNLLPLVSALGVTAICSAVIAANATALYSIGFKLVLAITIMHLLGGVAGYIIGAVFGLDVSSTRTLSIEVMMQNSSLAVSLANVHFANPATAVPGAVSATMHSVLGSILAAIWRFSSSKQPPSMVQEAPITVESLYRELDEEE